MHDLAADWLSYLTFDYFTYRGQKRLVIILTVHDDARHRLQPEGPRLSEMNPGRLDPTLQLVGSITPFLCIRSDGDVTIVNVRRL